MDPEEVRQHRRAVRRNIPSLLTSCERYSKLGGVELALYIHFPDDGRFVSYESTDLSWLRDIEAKVSSPTPPISNLA